MWRVRMHLSWYPDIQSACMKDIRSVKRFLTFITGKDYYRREHLFFFFFLLFRFFFRPRGEIAYSEITIHKASYDWSSVLFCFVLFFLSLTWYQEDKGQLLGVVGTDMPLPQLEGTVPLSEVGLCRMITNC